MEDIRDKNNKRQAKCRKNKKDNAKKEKKKEEKRTKVANKRKHNWEMRISMNTKRRKPECQFEDVACTDCDQCPASHFESNSDSPQPSTSSNSPQPSTSSNSPPSTSSDSGPFEMDTHSPSPPSDEMNINQTTTTRSFKLLSMRAKRRHVKKLKDLTNDYSPQSKAHLINEAFVRSPKTQKELVKMKIIAEPTTSVLADAIQEVITATKEKPGTSTKVKRTFFAETMAAVSRSAQKSKVLVERVALTVGVSRSAIYRFSKKKPEYTKLVKRKQRKDAIPQTVKTKVHLFYLKSDVSRVLPNKKDVLKKKTSKKQTNDALEPKHIMQMSQKEAFSMFKSENPGIKIGREMFRKLKPANVRRLSETSRIVCLCVTCHNVKLKVETLIRSNVSVTTSEILKRLTCPSEKLPDRKCLDEECEACGPAETRQRFAEFENKEGTITWDHWEYVSVEVKGVARNKIKPISKTASHKEFLTELQKDLTGYAAHRFRASWQQNRLKDAQELVMNSPPGLVLIQADFSEDANIQYSEGLLIYTSTCNLFLLKV